MKPTTEQKNIGQLTIAVKNIKVVAGAGCGKSSTLRYVAKQVPARNVLVLTFNKANAEETMEHPDRPDNLFACTIHSLAYRAIVDSFYKKKLGNWLDYNDIDQETIKKVIWRIGIAPTDERKALVLLRRSIIDTVKLFCQSANKDVVSFAKSYLTWAFITNTDPLFKVPLSENVVAELVSITATYWMDLIEKPDTKINPDVYLKLFHLQGHSIKEVWSVELKRYVTVQMLALDEAQDSNGVTEAIFANQKHLQRIVVGDPNQQLYRWRGAGDTMNQFNDFSIGYLSTSFRFNNEIARMANIVLERNNSQLRLTGNSTRTDIVTKAILCRTNATVLEIFFDMITSGKLTDCRETVTKHLGDTYTHGKLAISTDTKSTFAKMYHLEACWFDHTPKYPVPELSGITDKKSMIEALEYSDELQRLNNLRQKLVGMAGSLYKAQEMLKQYIAGTDDMPVVTISTIHGSKGMEYSHVTIADDFISIKEDEDIFEQVEYMWGNIDYRCMLYVALTRAMVSVTLPWYLESSFE
jgi:superfamily I DNA/RNA helicase